MRVAIFHNQPSGGARRAMHGFVRELAPRHDITIYTLTSADDEMLHDEDVAGAVHRSQFAFPRPRRGQLYLNDLRRRQGFSKLADTNRDAAAAIDAASYDVVLVDACRYVGAPYVLDHLRTPAVYFCHHRLFPIDRVSDAPVSSPYAWIRDRVHAPMERPLRRRLWRDDARLMSRAARILVGSEFSRHRLASLYNLQSTVCRYGVDVPDSQPSEQPPEHVLSVGTLERHKGHDLVIEALACVPREKRPPLLIIANDGNSAVRTALEVQARRRQVDVRIRMLPPQSELNRAYDQALVLAFGAHDEPLGLVVLEAMARGVPVVAVGEGGVLETVSDSDTGFLTGRDPVEMGARIGELLADASMRERMGANGRLRIHQDWAWSDRARELETVLQEVAGTNVGGAAKVVA